MTASLEKMALNQRLLCFAATSVDRAVELSTVCSSWRESVASEYGGVVVHTALFRSGTKSRPAAMMNLIHVTALGDKPKAGERNKGFREKFKFQRAVPDWFIISAIHSFAGGGHPSSSFSSTTSTASSSSLSPAIKMAHVMTLLKHYHQSSHGTLLHALAARKDAQLLKYFLDFVTSAPGCANLDVQGHSGLNAFQYAVHVNCDVDIVQMLVELRHTTRRQRNAYVFDPSLGQSATANQEQVLQSRTVSGNPLYTACLNGNWAVLKYLIDVMNERRRKKQPPTSKSTTTTITTAAAAAANENQEDEMPWIMHPSHDGLLRSSTTRFHIDALNRSKCVATLLSEVFDPLLDEGDGAVSETKRRAILRRVEKEVGEALSFMFGLNSGDIDFTLFEIFFRFCRRKRRRAPPSTAAAGSVAETANNDTTSLLQLFMDKALDQMTYGGRSALNETHYKFLLQELADAPFLGRADQFASAFAINDVARMRFLIESADLFFSRAASLSSSSSSVAAAASTASISSSSSSSSSSSAQRISLAEFLNEAFRCNKLLRIDGSFWQQYEGESSSFFRKGPAAPMFALLHKSGLDLGHETVLNAVLKGGCFYVRALMHTRGANCGSDADRGCAIMRALLQHVKADEKMMLAACLANSSRSILEIWKSGAVDLSKVENRPLISAQYDGARDVHSLIEQTVNPGKFLVAAMANYHSSSYHKRPESSELTAEERWARFY